MLRGAMEPFHPGGGGVYTGHIIKIYNFVSPLNFPLKGNTENFNTVSYLTCNYGVINRESIVMRTKGILSDCYK
jgi:hypothetical protein